MHRLLSANMICTKMRKVFPRTKLKENCELRETFNVQGKIAVHICAQTEAILFITLHIFCNAREKMLTNSLLYAAWDVFFSGVFSVST